jgi:hypothetical protein
VDAKCSKYVGMVFNNLNLKLKILFDNNLFVPSILINVI